MHFENPFLLLGLLGGLIPVIIHLINRRQAQILPFAAIGFILRTNKRIARRLKLKQFLILLFRILLICAIPFALSRPFSSEDTASIDGAESPMSLVIVIDNSLSMGVVDDAGVTRFDRAKERAITLLESLSAESNLGIVESAGEGRALTPELTFEHSRILQAISEMEIQDGRGDPSKALRVAETLLAKSSLQDRRVLFISDLQLTEWENFESPWSLTPAPFVQFESIQEERLLSNHAVTHIDVQRAREVSPSHIRVSATIAALGSEPYVGPVSLQIGEKSAQNTIRVEPGTSGLSTFLVKAGAETDSLGQVSIRKDALSADDTRNFSLGFSRGLDVLVVNGSPRSIPYRDELFFLERALQAKDSETRIRVSARKANEVTEQQFKSADVVVLANVLKLSDELVTALDAFVSNGGGLLFSGGDNVTLEYNRIFGNLMPMPVRAVKKVVNTEEKKASLAMIGLDPLDREHSALRVFSSIQNASIYDARFHTYVLLDGPTGGPNEVKVMSTYGNGAPFLVESMRKRGRIIFWSSTLDQDWGTLPIQTSYVPLLQQLLLYLGGRLEGSKLTDSIVGNAARLPFRGEDVKVELTHPSGWLRSFELRRQDPRKGLFVDQLREAGIYQLSHFTKNDPNPRVSFFPVHPPQEESALLALPIVDAQIHVSSDRNTENVNRAVQVPLSSDPTRTNLWPYILLALFGLLGMEALLASRTR
jgi:hypothetical protein